MKSPPPPCSRRTLGAALKPLSTSSSTGDFLREEGQRGTGGGQEASERWETAHAEPALL